MPSVHNGILQRDQSQDCMQENAVRARLISASDLLGALGVCDEHRFEVLEFINILQGLIIKQDNLALLTRDES